MNDIFASKRVKGDTPSSHLTFSGLMFFVVDATQF